MKELWTQDEAEYHGKFYDFPGSPVFSQAGPETAPAGVHGRLVEVRV